MNSSLFPSSEQLDLHLESCRNLVYSLELLELEILNSEKKSSNSEGCQKHGILYDRPGKRWMQSSTAETGPASAVITKQLTSPLRFKPVGTEHHSSIDYTEAARESNLNLGNERISTNLDGVAQSRLVSTDSLRTFTLKSSPGGRAGIKHLTPKVIIPDSKFGKWLCPKCGKRKRSNKKVFIFHMTLYSLTLLLIKHFFE